MIYRVQIERVVRQAGYVEIEAEDEREARACVEKFAATKGHTAFAPTWTEDIKQRGIEVVNVEAM